MDRQSMAVYGSVSVLWALVALVADPPLRYGASVMAALFMFALVRFVHA